MPGSLLLKQPPHFLRDAKKAGKKVATLTAYDYPTARLLDDCGVDILATPWAWSSLATPTPHP